MTAAASESLVFAVRRLQFCAGHRVYRHESKCANLHGHNYVVFLHARAKAGADISGTSKSSASSGLDELGRVIDFGVLKARFEPWISSNWDHGFILWQDDAEGRAAMEKVSGQKLFLLDTNPTAENMALHLLHVVAPAVLGDCAVEVHKVVLWETENCYVEVDKS